MNLGVRECHSLRRGAQVDEKISGRIYKLCFTRAECEGPVRYTNGDNGPKLTILSGVQKCNLGCRYSFESHSIRSCKSKCLQDPGR